MVSWQHATWLVVFFLLPVVAIPGNALLVCFSLRRGRHLAAADALMVLLAVLDVVKVILVTLVAFESYYHNSWTLGQVLCQLTMRSLFVLYFMALVVILFLTRIRHVAIISTVHCSSVSLRTVSLLCLGLGVVLVALASVPDLYNWEVAVYGSTRICQLEFKVPRWLWIACQFSALAVTLTPSCYLLYVCYRVRHTLDISLRNLKATANITRDALTRRQQDNRRVVLALATMAIGFTLCWVPVNVLHALELFRVDKPSERERLDELFAFHVCFFLWLVGFESCVSTMAFGLFNRSFRLFVRSMFTRRRQRHSTTSTSGLPLAVTSADLEFRGVDNNSVWYISEDELSNGN